MSLILLLALYCVYSTYMYMYVYKCVHSTAFVWPAIPAINAHIRPLLAVVESVVVQCTLYTCMYVCVCVLIIGFLSMYTCIVILALLLQPSSLC